MYCVSNSDTLARSFSSQRVLAQNDFYVPRPFYGTREKEDGVGVW